MAYIMPTVINVMKYGFNKASNLSNATFLKDSEGLKKVPERKKKMGTLTEKITLYILPFIMNNRKQCPKTISRIPMPLAISTTLFRPSNLHLHIT